MQSSYRKEEKNSEGQMQKQHGVDTCWTWIHAVVGLMPILHWSAGHRPEAGRDGDVRVPSTAEALLSETGGKTPTQPGTERQDHQRQQIILRGAFNLGPLPVAQ